MRLFWKPHELKKTQSRQIIALLRIAYFPRGKAFGKYVTTSGIALWPTAHDMPSRIYDEGKQVAVTNPLLLALSTLSALSVSSSKPTLRGDPLSLSPFRAMER
ncbi:hypothetical protein E4U27_006542 [Claviceps purpurea]|nr:hypothetical protein E4U27_006542 [Claviceps purpurea]